MVRLPATIAAAARHGGRRAVAARGFRRDARYLGSAWAASRLLSGRPSALRTSATGRRRHPGGPAPARAIPAFHGHALHYVVFWGFADSVLRAHPPARRRAGFSTGAIGASSAGRARCASIRATIGLPTCWADDSRHGLSGEADPACIDAASRTIARGAVRPRWSHIAAARQPRQLAGRLSRCASHRRAPAGVRPATSRDGVVVLYHNERLDGRTTPLHAGRGLGAAIPTPHHARRTAGRVAQHGRAARYTFDSSSAASAQTAPALRERG